MTAQTDVLKHQLGDVPTHPFRMGYGASRASRASQPYQAMGYGDGFRMICVALCVTNPHTPEELAIGRETAAEETALAQFFQPDLPVLRAAEWDRRILDVVGQAFQPDLHLGNHFHGSTESRVGRCAPQRRRRWSCRVACSVSVSLVILGLNNHEHNGEDTIMEPGPVGRVLTEAKIENQRMMCPS